MQPELDRCDAVKPHLIRFPDDDGPSSGLYRIESQDESVLYVGESSDLRMRMSDHFEKPASRDFWNTLAEGVPRVRYQCSAPEEPQRQRMLKWHAELQRHGDTLTNLFDLWMPIA